MISRSAERSSASSFSWRWESRSALTIRDPDRRSDLAGYRCGRQRMIAGDHDHPDPGAVTAIDRRLDLGAWRIEHRH